MANRLNELFQPRGNPAHQAKLVGHSNVLAKRFCGRHFWLAPNGPKGCALTVRAPLPELQMRSSFIALVAIAFALACVDAPTTPPLQPDAPSFAIGKAPPPWALIEGEITTDGSGSTLTRLSLSRVAGGGALMSHSGNAATYRAWLLITPGNQATLLRFTEGGTATFSNGAMISKVNGKVSGRGTMTVGGRKYELSAVTELSGDGDCTTAPWDHAGPSCASFSADDGSFSSEGSVWTGVVSNDPDGVAPVPGCATNADFVVTNQAGLTSALAAVGAGGTIAINGIIDVSAAVVIQADDIRLTCATAGSGLRSSVGSAPFAVLRVMGDGVQVDNLLLSTVPSNGVGGAENAVFAFSSTLNPVERFRLSLNLIRCGHVAGTCAFLVGAPGAVVSDNTLESLGTLSGIHVQRAGAGVGAILTDNTVVERNSVVSPTVSGSPLFGAIRVRDGNHVVVRHNSTSGAWRNGIALAELNGALIESNSIRGAQDHGILASTNALLPVSLRNSTIRGNRIDGPQAIGINLNRACWNRVEANDISVSPGTLRARFEATTGANVYAGASPARVLDQGNFDCDGDNVTDPNTISGSSSASSSQASSARIPAGSSRLYRSAPQSDGTKLPQLQ